MMIDDVSDIKEYYDERVDGEMGRLVRNQLEHDITWRYFDKYLPRKGDILEIGAGAGTITIGLLRRGYKVSAVDISPKMMEFCLKRAAEEGLGKNLLCYAKDARDLGEIKEKAFDAVLMMGPLYHLVYKEDRETVLKEAYRRLKQSGIIFSTFISRFGIWGAVLKQIPESIERQKDLNSVLECGRDSDESPVGGFRGYFATVDEIPPLHEEIGFETLVMASAEPCISADNESYNKLKGKRRRMWLDLFYKLSSEKSILATSRHLIYIGRKP